MNHVERQILTDINVNAELVYVALRESVRREGVPKAMGSEILDAASKLFHEVICSLDNLTR